MKSCFALFVLLAACSSSAPKAQAPQSAAVPEEIPSGTVAECVGPDDQAVDCLTDDDCCAGFECGRDPDVSARRLVCVYSG